MRKFVFVCLLFICLSVQIRSRKHSLKRKLSAIRKSSVGASILHSKKLIVGAKNAINLKNGSYAINPKNVSYTINPRMFTNYVDQFDKIKSLGEEVKCKLHGTCAKDLKRHHIRHDSHHDVFRHRKHDIVDKKSMQSFSEQNIPDNSNQFIQPPLSPVSPEMMSQAMGAPDASSYSNQQNAAEFGQQPQMNLKIPGEAGMGGPGGPGGIPSLEQMQNAANDASIQNSIKNKMNFMDSANDGMMQMSPGQMPPGMPGAPMQPGGMTPGGMPEMNPGGAGGTHPGFARHHGSPRKDRERMEEEHHGGEQQPGDERKEEEDEHIRVDGGPRGVPNGESASVSDEDIYKAEGVQPNEMKDLHNFLSHNRKPKGGGSEEEESERENEEFEENERGHRSREHGHGHGHDDGGPYEQDEREEGGHENRSPEKEEGDEGEPHGRPSNENEEFEEEAKQKHNSNHNQVVPPGHGAPNEGMGPMGDPMGGPMGGPMGPGVPGSPVAPPGMAMDPGAEMDPGRAGLKPGTPEVPTLNNLMGGSMPLQILQDQSMAETGPGGRPNVDFDSQGRFVSENQRNMMESNSDYDVPKTGFRKHFHPIDARPNLYP